MKIYEVGGCVRDRILGLEPKDIDYVVVGSSEKEMFSLGYQLVGKDFPVFLHPETGHEYALARKEKKTGAGYGGFETETANVSLEEDLFRRDLTMNAIAMDKFGKIFDPYHGASDIKNGILRHVSDHFAEDPVRILRISRFSARYNFEIAPETYILMNKIVLDGEFNNLTKERVWKEFEKTLHEPHLNNFFNALEKTNALNKIFSFNIFPDKEFFKNPRTFNEKLCHVFSFSNDNEIKKWKMPENEQQLIFQYKKYYKNWNFYSSMTNEEKLVFINTTKAIHQSEHSIKILDLVINYKNYVKETINKEFETKVLLNDINSIKNINYEEIISQITDKKNIGKEIKAIQSEALKNASIISTTKLKI